MTTFRPINGACHCGNIRFAFQWPISETEIPVRMCGCTFCKKHAGAWTSHPNGKLSAEIGDESKLSKYTFGTETAEFYICTECGVVPFVLSEIDDQIYAVVNVNTFGPTDGLSLTTSTTDFDGEETGDRLERRKRNWALLVALTYD